MRFVDLKKQYEQIQEGINKRFQSVLENTHFIMGKEVIELETILADYVGSKYCITCANGTDALQIALMAEGIGTGDAVFVPTFTFYSTAEVVSLTGATPIFIDVKPETFNIDVNKLELAIQNVESEGSLIPRAVIPVDLFGLPADHKEIRIVAQKYDMIIVEDGAQGFGGSINDKKACSFGDISTTSFFPSKPLGCYGDGGAIFTDDDSMAELMQSIRIHGKGKDKYQNVRIGLNSRLDTLQAAVLLEKIKLFDAELIARNKVASQYSEGLKEVLIIPTIETGSDRQFYSSWAQYSVLAKNEEARMNFIKGLKDKGVPTMIYYPTPLHLQKAFNNLVIKKDYCDLTVSEDICKRVFSLPMHPYLSEQEIDYIINSIKQICK